MPPYPRMFARTHGAREHFFAPGSDPCLRVRGEIARVTNTPRPGPSCIICGNRIPRATRKSWRRRKYRFLGMTREVSVDIWLRARRTRFPGRMTAPAVHNFRQVLTTSGSIVGLSSESVSRQTASCDDYWEKRADRVFHSSLSNLSRSIDYSPPEQESLSCSADLKRQSPLPTANSHGRCNTLAKSLCGCFEV